MTVAQLLGEAEPNPVREPVLGASHMRERAQVLILYRTPTRTVNHRNQLVCTERPSRETSPCRGDLALPGVVAREGRLGADRLVTVAGSVRVEVRPEQSPYFQPRPAIVAQPPAPNLPFGAVVWRHILPPSSFPCG